MKDLEVVRVLADQALVYDQAASRLAPPGFDPSRITAAIAAIDGQVLQPIIRKASEDFYEATLAAAEDYLRENLDWNLSSHLTMLERENQRMRTELFEVDRTIGGAPLGHAGRLHAIALLDLGSRRHSELVYQVSRKYEGETRHETALRYLRERDSDGNPQGGDGTAPSQSDDSAGLQGIAPTPSVGSETATDAVKREGGA